MFKGGGGCDCCLYDLAAAFLKEFQCSPLYEESQKLVSIETEGKCLLKLT